MSRVRRSIVSLSHTKNARISMHRLRAREKERRAPESNADVVKRKYHVVHVQAHAVLNGAKKRKKKWVKV